MAELTWIGKNFCGQKMTWSGNFETAKKFMTKNGFSIDRFKTFFRELNHFKLFKCDMSIELLKNFSGWRTFFKIWMDSMETIKPMLTAPLCSIRTNGLNLAKKILTYLLHTENASENLAPASAGIMWMGKMLSLWSL